MMLHLDTDLLKHLDDKRAPLTDHQRTVIRIRRAERHETMLRLMAKVRSVAELCGQRLGSKYANSPPPFRWQS